MEIIAENEHQRMRWASRRGMLELDLLLAPYVDSAYVGLDTAGQHRYRRLMECEDQELFGWFLRRERPADPDLATMVDDIIDFSRNRAVPR